MAASISHNRKPRRAGAVLWLHCAGLGAVQPSIGAGLPTFARIIGDL